MITAQTFPGVYPSVTDKSFLPTTTSRFHPALVGVAEKGPFNQAVSVRSLREFQQTFGKSLANRYMANYASVLSPLTDGLTVVRVGSQYESQGVTDASGTAGDYTIYTPKANQFTALDYVRITQPGKHSTVNAQIYSADSTSLELVYPNTSDHIELADGYESATIESCPTAEAANEAETFLYAYQYDSALNAAGNVIGNKNDYEFTIETIPLNGSGVALLNAGDLIKIAQTGKVTTAEVRIKEIKAQLDGRCRVLLETSNNTEIGYQALPLQDSYLTGRIYKVTKIGNTYQTTLAIQFVAATAGEWANSDGVKTGMIVTVAPGSNAGTKKLQVWYNSTLAETIDNLSDDPTSDDYYVTRIQGNSDYIDIPVNCPFTGHPANTLNPWNTTSNQVLNIGAFDKGYNGSTPADSDFIGTINPVDDSATGLKVLEDENLTVDVICCPDIPVLSGATGWMGVHQEMARISSKIFALGLMDVPKDLNGREAVDWHNGAGMYSARGRIDNYVMACFWNWGTISDTWTGDDVVVPPSLAALRAMAYTFDHFKPWSIAAGDVRGVVPELTNLQYLRYSHDTKSAMYGAGNSVNGVFLMNGRFEVYGDRTMQRAESKLTAIHSVILTNYLMRNLGLLGRQFVFEPNDAQLLEDIDTEFRGFLDSVQNDRGMEEYSLKVSASAENRNRREVIVDFDYIPVDGAERIYVQATVRASGSQLNSIQ